MIVFTTKLTRRKMVSAVLVICILICSCVVFLRNLDAKESAAIADDSENTPVFTKIKTNKDRVMVLKSFGWEVDEKPLESMEVRIPVDFEGVYEEYNEMQMNQGFDLKKYSGKKVMRYTYKINNYEGDDEVVANIIIFKNNLIAGDVCSPKMGGFMHGLKKDAQTYGEQTDKNIAENGQKEEQD